MSKVEISHGLVLSRLNGNIDWPRLQTTTFCWVRALNGRGTDRKTASHVQAAVDHGLAVATVCEADRRIGAREQAELFQPHIVGRAGVLRLDQGDWKPENPRADARWIHEFWQYMPGVTLRVVAPRIVLHHVLADHLAAEVKPEWTACLSETAAARPTVDGGGPAALAKTGIPQDARAAGTLLTHWLWNRESTVRQISGPVGRVARIRHVG